MVIVNKIFAQSDICALLLSLRLFLKQITVLGSVADR